MGHGRRVYFDVAQVCELRRPQIVTILNENGTVIRCDS
jgi:hypothetical protein